MSQTAPDVNEVVSLTPDTANLANVSLAVEAAEVAMGHDDHLPGMVTFTGFSGLGKSLAVSYVAQVYRGFYIEIQDNWSKIDLIKMLMFVIGIKRLKGWSENDCVQAIIDELSTCRRPLILDEFDQLIDRKYIASSMMLLILNIAKKSGAAILLVGEELLPHKIANYEKFDNCIYDRYYAVTSEISDSRIMARHYYPDLEIRDDLLEKTVLECKGITRRICINLACYAAEASALGITSIGLAEWGNKPINTGRAAKPRSLK